jgi:hypothetical protein
MESESDSGSSPDSRWRTIRSPKQTLSTGGAACFIAGMTILFGAVAFLGACMAIILDQQK